MQRLKRRSDFLRVAGARRKCAMPGLVLQARPQEEAGGATRVGYTASRKVGGAVQRNRARRRLKAAAGRIIPGHAKAGFDLVLIARGATARRPFRALIGDLEAALKRVGAWCGDDAGDTETPPPRGRHEEGKLKVNP